MIIYTCTIDARPGFKTRGEKEDNILEAFSGIKYRAKPKETKQHNRICMFTY